MKKLSLTKLAAILGVSVLLAACSNSATKESASNTSNPAAQQAAVEPSSTSTTATQAVAETKDNTSVDGPIMDFTAYGADPNWRAVIEGEKISLEGEDIEEGTYAVERSAYAKGVEYYGKTAQTEFSLGITSKECHDTAGQKTEFTVSFTYGKKTLKGCAVAGAFEHADT